MDRRSLLRFAGLAALGSALPLSTGEATSPSRPSGATAPPDSTLPVRRRFRRDSERLDAAAGRSSTA